MRGSRRGTGVRTPLENHKAIAIVINTDLDPMEKRKSYQISIQF